MTKTANRRAEAIAALERRLGHGFVDRDLLERALTHSSASHGATKAPDNERLEFLGDRVLGLIVARRLMDSEPEATAGMLSKRLASLVSRQACARAARDMGLGEALRLQGGESRRGARDHETILADACEAVIAALYLETGLERTAEIVLRLWDPLLSEPVDLAMADPKSSLQEWAAAHGRPPPAYALVSRTGPDHQPEFTVSVDVAEGDAATGVGGSLQSAQKAAALSLLIRLKGTK